MTTKTHTHKIKLQPQGPSCQSCQGLAEFAVIVDGRTRYACQGHSAAVVMHCDVCRYDES